MSHVPVSIVDVQGSLDERRIDIDKVGIKNLRHPVRIRDRSPDSQHSIATLSMYVALPHSQRGTHMSRFIEIMNTHEQVISVENFADLLTRVAEALDSDAAHVEMSFPFFVTKHAPKSGVPSLLDYDVTLIGDRINGESSVTIRVVVPVTSLCPCSKQISDYGAHNQRSHVTVTVNATDVVWIEEIIDVVEQEASCEIFGLIKRPDEKYITERAYDNPKFVEDMVRDVAAHLKLDQRILSFSVESENFESIHNHSAYARVDHRNI